MTSVMQNELAFFKSQAVPNVNPRNEFLERVSETLRSEKAGLEEKLLRIEKFDLPFSLDRNALEVACDNGAIPPFRVQRFSNGWAPAPFGKGMRLSFRPRRLQNNLGAS